MGSPGTEWWRPDAAVKGGEASRPIAAWAVPDSALPFWALMGFTLVLLLAPQTHLPIPGSLRVGLLTAALAVAAHLFHRFIHLRPLTILNREIWITACLVGWAIITLPLSYWPGGSVSFLFGFYFKALAIFWLIANVVNTLSRLRLVAWGLSLMALPMAVSGINSYLSGEFIPDGSPVKRIGGYDAPLVANPNDLALTLNLILPLSLALLLAGRKWSVRIVLLPIIFLSIVAVIVTFSRAGFLALVTTYVLYVGRRLRRRERGWAWCALALLLLAVPVVPSDYAGRLSTIVDIESDPTGSAQGRWRGLGSAARIVLKNPVFGAGVGMETLALNDENGPFWADVHNVYLQYAVGLGVPGLVLFLLLLWGCFKNATTVQRRAYRVPALRELSYLAEGIQLSLVAFAVEAVFAPVAYHFYFYYVAGLAVAVRAVYDGQEGHGVRAIQLGAQQDGIACRPGDREGMATGPSTLTAR